MDKLRLKKGWFRVKHTDKNGIQNFSVTKVLSLISIVFRKNQPTMIKIKVQSNSQMSPSSKCPYYSSKLVTPLQLLTLSPKHLFW